MDSRVECFPGSRVYLHLARAYAWRVKTPEAVPTVARLCTSGSLLKAAEVLVVRELPSLGVCRISPSPYISAAAIFSPSAQSLAGLSTAAASPAGPHCQCH